MGITRSSLLNRRLVKKPSSLLKKCFCRWCGQDVMGVFVDTFSFDDGSYFTFFNFMKCKKIIKNLKLF